MKKEITFTETTTITLTEKASETNDVILKKMLEECCIPSFMVEKITYPERIIDIKIKG